MIDGCSAWQRFWKIVLPLSAPALVATAILSAILAWNEFLFAVMLTRVNAKTLPVVMSGFITDKGTPVGPDDRPRRDHCPARCWSSRSPCSAIWSGD